MIYIQHTYIQLITIELLRNWSKDKVPVQMILLTCNFGVERYLNVANRNKVLGTTLHTTVDSTAYNPSTTYHPWSLNQHTTARESFVSLHFSPQRMGEGMVSHLPQHLLNRWNIAKGTTCTYSMCQHATLFLCFKFYLS